MATIEELKAKRKELKMTFEELSVKSGIPLRTLENIFHGVTKNPRIDTMQAIEQALGIEKEKTPPDEDLSEGERKIIELASYLTEEEIEEIIKFIDFLVSKRKR